MSNLNILQIDKQNQQMEKRIQKTLSANAFQLNIDLYFWMLDRGDFQDDQKNQVDIANQRVRLTREHGHRLENGLYIGKLMHAIRKTIIKKSKKPFTLDPTLSNLKDQTTSAAKEYNWNLIVSELKKFNMKYNKEQKDQIIKETRHSLIIDILQKLQLYDQNLLAFNNGNQNPSLPDTFDNIGLKESLKARKSPDVQSEINFGNNNLERQNKINDIESHQDDGRSELQSISQHGQNKLMAGAPSKKQLLDPINQESTLDEFGQYFEQPNPKQQEKSLIQLHQMQMINDDLDKSLNFDTNDNQFEEYQPKMQQAIPEAVNPLGDEINDADTAVLYVFATLKQGFGLRQNQVGGLLSEKNKYLVQMCVRGGKGGDFDKVRKWYNLIYGTVPRLIYLLQNELDQIPPTLNVIKSGLFSKDCDVAILCARVFTKLVSLINENSQNPAMIEFKHHFWDWLTVTQKIQAKKNAELENFQNEPGIKAFVRAQVRHPTEFIDQFALFLIQAGEGNQIEMFTHHLRLNCANSLSYLELMHDMFDILNQTQSGRIAFIESGVLNVLIDMALQIAGTASTVVGDSGFPGSNPQMLSERTVSFVFLVDIWKQKADFIQSRANESRMAEAIVRILKQGCRDRSKAVAILSMNLLASLLDQFSKERNKYAPIILKALTFILIDLYLYNDLREEMLHNFISLFKSQPSIPIQIVCEPLFKQIQINLEKQDFMIVNSNILQPQRDIFDLNSTDFLFFMNIAIHQKLTQNIAIQLLSIVIEISRKNLIYTRISLKLLLTILNRFENNTAVFEFCQQEIKNDFSTLMKQDQQKVEIYKELMKNPKTQIAAKKRAQQLSINNSLDMGGQGFIATIGKNSHNVKYRNGDHPTLLEKNRGIIAQGLSNDKFLDDTDLQNMLNYQVHQQESSEYLKLRTNEKMIVNQLQCLTNTGIKVLQDFIRDQLLETYIKIEKKFKFKNKGIIYLLQLFNQDVTKMLQFYYTEQQKQRAEIARMKKLQKEQDLAQTREHTEEDEVYPLPSLKEKNFSALNKYNDSIGSINERDSLFQEPYTSLTVKKQPLKTKFIINNDDDEDDYYGGGGTLDLTYEKKSTIKRKRNSSVQSMDSMGKGRRGLTGIGIGEVRTERRKLGERVGPIKALEVGRSKMTEKIELYDPAEYEGEGSKYISWIKKYLKLYKAMFHKYTAISKNKNGLKKNTFDNMIEQRQIMNLFETFSFLNDFQILQNFPEIKRDDIKNLINYSNLKNSAVARPNTTEIDLEGFIELILQIAYIVSDRMEKASVFLPKFFKYMRQVSLVSDVPLFQRLFEDPQATSIGDPQVIRELERKLNLDPNYQLPPGFVKYRKEEMINTYQPPSLLSEPNQVALMLIDDIYFDIFGDHYLEPEVSYVEVWGVKPDVFKKNIKKNIKSQYMRIDPKHQFNGRGASVDIETPKMRIKDTRINQDIRYASQPRNEFAKKKSIRKRPVMEMDTTLQPEIDLSLKVILAENLRHPNRAELKESAVVLNDMLAAIDNGDNFIDPLVREKYYKEQKGPVLNKLKQHKDMLAMEKHLDEQAKIKQRLQRDAKLKRELEFFNQQRQIKNQQKTIAEKQRLQEQANEKKKADQRKKAYYDQLKIEFVSKRLPMLQETSEIDSSLKQMSVQKQKHDKRNAKEFLANQTLEQSKQFAAAIERREKEQRDKEREEKLRKEKLRMKNLQLASKFKQKETVRSSMGSIPRNSSLSPANKGTLSSQKAPAPLQKSTTKSVQQLPAINRSVSSVPTQKQLDKLTNDEKRARIEELKRQMQQANQATGGARQGSVQPQRNAQIRR